MPWSAACRGVCSCADHACAAPFELARQMYAAHVERQARIRRAAVLGLICGADDTSDEDDSDFSDFGSMLLAAVFFKAASKRNHAKRVRFTRVTDGELLARDDVSFRDQMRYCKSTVRIFIGMNLTPRT